MMLWSLWLAYIHCIHLLLACMSLMAKNISFCCSALERTFCYTGNWWYLCRCHDGNPATAFWTQTRNSFVPILVSMRRQSRLVTQLCSTIWQTRGNFSYIITSMLKDWTWYRKRHPYEFLWLTAHLSWFTLHNSCQNRWSIWNAFTN